MCLQQINVKSKGAEHGICCWHGEFRQLTLTWKILTMEQVAGFAAYLLQSSSFNPRPGSVAADIRNSFSSRTGRPILPRYEPKVIWNLQDGSKNPNASPRGTMPLSHRSVRGMKCWPAMSRLIEVTHDACRMALGH